MQKKSNFGPVAVLSALVVVLAVANVVQMAMTPQAAVGQQPGASTDVSKYRGGERAEMTDALKDLDGTVKQLLDEVKGLRADMTSGKVQVQVVKPAEE
jgi:hypothetical protein